MPDVIVGDAILTITDLEGSDTEYFNFTIDGTDVYPYNVGTPQIIDLYTGWNMFGLIKQPSSLHLHGTAGTVAGGDSAMTIRELFINNLIDTDGNIVAADGTTQAEKSTLVGNYVIIMKNNLGVAYLPEWNFDGIGELTDFEAYQIKVSQPCRIVVWGKDYVFLSGDYEGQRGAIVPLATGWNQKCFPIYDTPRNLESILNNTAGGINSIIIAKDNLGQALLPLYDFNGIGEIFPGEGLQLKVEASAGSVTVVDSYISGGFIDFTGTGSYGDPDPDTDPEDDNPPTDIITTVIGKSSALGDILVDENFDPDIFEILDIKYKLLAAFGILTGGELQAIQAEYDGIILGLTGHGSHVLEIEMKKSGKNSSGKEDQIQEGNYFTTVYPYFKPNFRFTVNRIFANAILKNEKGLRTEHYFALLFQAVNIYIRAKNPSGVTYGYSKKLMPIKGSIPDTPASLIGDDALAAGIQGFTHHQAYSLFLKTVSKTASGKVHENNLTPTFASSGHTISAADKLGLFESDSVQIVESLTIS